MTLSPTQTQILTATAQHEHGFAKSPPGLPAGARNAVFRSMLRNGLLTDVAAQPEHVALAWRRNEGGTPMVARITDAGLHAIGFSLTNRQQPADAPYTPSDAATLDASAPALAAAHEAPGGLRGNLRAAAAAVLAAWDAGEHGSADLTRAMRARATRWRCTGSRPPSRGITV